MRARKKKRTGVSHAEALRVQQRIEEILRIRLAGAQFWDVREYVREKEQEDGSPWKLLARGKPLSDSQLHRYIRRADLLIQRSVKEKRSRALRRHLARRESMYAAAINAGDVRTALAVEQDEARLRGLYPETRTSKPTASDPDPESDTEGPVREIVVRTREEAAALLPVLGATGGIPERE